MSFKQYGKPRRIGSQTESETENSVVPKPKKRTYLTRKNIDKLFPDDTYISYEAENPIFANITKRQWKNAQKYFIARKNEHELQKAIQNANNLNLLLNHELTRGNRMKMAESEMITKTPPDMRAITYVKSSGDDFSKDPEQKPKLSLSNPGVLDIKPKRTRVKKLNEKTLSINKQEDLNINPNEKTLTVNKQEDLNIKPNVKTLSVNKQNDLDIKPTTKIISDHKPIIDSDPFRFKYGSNYQDVKLMDPVVKGTLMKMTYLNEMYKNTNRLRKNKLKRFRGYNKNKKNKKSKK